MVAPASPTLRFSSPEASGPVGSRCAGAHGGVAPHVAVAAAEGDLGRDVEDGFHLLPGCSSPICGVLSAETSAGQVAARRKQDLFGERADARRAVPVGGERFDDPQPPEGPDFDARVGQRVRRAGGAGAQIVLPAVEQQGARAARSCRWRCRSTAHRVFGSLYRYWPYRFIQEDGLAVTRTLVYMLLPRMP